MEVYTNLSSDIPKLYDMLKICQNIQLFILNLMYIKIHIPHQENGNCK